MGLEHLPDPSELKSEMLESTAEFHSYAESENYKKYFVIDDSVKLTAPPSRNCAFCDRKDECEEYRRAIQN